MRNHDDYLFFGLLFVVAVAGLALALNAKPDGRSIVEVLAIVATPIVLGGIWITLRDYVTLLPSGQPTFDGKKLLAFVFRILEVTGLAIAGGGLWLTLEQTGLTRVALRDQQTVTAYQLLESKTAGPSVKLRSVSFLANAGEHLTQVDISCGNPPNDPRFETVYCDTVSNFVLGNTEDPLQIDWLTLPNIEVVMANWRGVKFTHLRTSGVNFDGGDIKDTTFVDAVFQGTMFDYTTMTDTRFWNSDISHADFATTRLQRMGFSFTNISDLRFCTPASDLGRNRFVQMEMPVRDEELLTLRPYGCANIGDEVDFGTAWFEEGLPPRDVPQKVSIGWVCPIGTVPPIDATEKYFDKNCRSPDPFGDFMVTTPARR